MKISVVICAFNPNISYLVKTLTAIEGAMVNINCEHEILLVDNNSNNDFMKDPSILTLVNKLKLIYILELKQGLTNARLSAIRYSNGDYIVFVDDDNVVDLMFFKNGINIAKSHPFIGSYSGSVNLIFEEHPKSHLESYLGLLVRRDVKQDLWSNQYFNNHTMPCGAGLWVQRDVATFYLKIHENGTKRLVTDRVGDQLTSGGDNDLAMCAIDVGLGMGLFAALNVDHLISARRVKESYLLRLNEGIEYSAVILHYVRTGLIIKNTFKSRLVNFLTVILAGRTKRKFLLSTFRGRRKAIALLLNI